MAPFRACETGSFSCATTETESQSPLRMSFPPPNVTLVPLCQLPAGALGRVRELKGTPEFCQRVREMGFGEQAFVTKVSGNGTILCQVNTTRLALSHDAAKSILVEQMSRR